MNLKSLRLAGHITRMDVKINRHRILIEKPVGMLPVGRPKMRCKNNIKCILRKSIPRMGSGLRWSRIVSSGGFCVGVESWECTDRELLN